MIPVFGVEGRVERFGRPSCIEAKAHDFTGNPVFDPSLSISESERGTVRRLEANGHQSKARRLEPFTGNPVYLPIGRKGNDGYLTEGLAPE